MIPLRVLDELDAVTIPVTCPVSWETMHGDRRTRFCDTCSQNVHDVSELTRAEAVQLLTGSDNLPCLRIYQRPDGRVMTSDCATKRERAWKWLHKRSRWAAALFALVFFASCDRPCLRTQGKPAGAYHETPAEHTVIGATQSIVEGIVSEAAAQNKAATGR